MEIHFRKIMQNDAGEVVDIYIPRKCSATNNIISAKDHASVQISIAEVDNEGRMTGSSKTFAFCGKVRSAGESDDALINLCMKDGIISKNYNL
ncbi:small ribosomal subunit protein eS21 isoform X2 [Hydra vulgaris]|uniref:40S ribosomal protein S21 n=1 Tax=Hydra vulgaris TaxID=6087 RepID=A0ABM4CZC2_HYDVU